MRIGNINISDSLTKAIIKSLIDNLVKDGVIDPRGKSKLELTREIKKYIKRRDSKIKVVLNHLPTLLKEARNHKSRSQQEISIVLFCVDRALG